MGVGVDKGWKAGSLFIGHTCLPPCSHRVLLTRAAPPCGPAGSFQQEKVTAPAHLLRLEPHSNSFLLLQAEVPRTAGCDFTVWA